MRLATLLNDTPDGQLIVVSADSARYLVAGPDMPSLQAAIERWEEAHTPLRTLQNLLDDGEGEALDHRRLMAALPRAWQWLDGSVYPSHGALMDQALGIAKPKIEFPLMYQGASDRFHSPTDDIAIPSEDLGIDFEGEFGVIVDAVPMGTSATDALRHIKLLVQINDWSLRTLAGPEMRTGFGWIQAKPHCSMAPIAVTPDELADAWRGGRPCLDLLVDWNGERFGCVNGEPMEYGFHELVAHAARTRPLVAGTVIGSGTVSNANFREVGSSCIAERRGIEVIDLGEAQTSFMKFGDMVTMTAVTDDGRAPFGTISQKVVRYA